MYENVPAFCYTCEWLGHGADACQWPWEEGKQGGRMSHPKNFFASLMADEEEAMAQEMTVAAGRPCLRP